MMWQEVPEPIPERIRPIGWLRVIAKGLPIAILVLGGLVALLLARLIERPLCGLDRPVTPFITQFVCRNSIRIIGISYSVDGHPMSEPGAVVANHASWLDIFALNACQRVYFVSKAEVAAWPLIGWLARATGTLFIRRDRSDAANQKQLMETRLKAGHKLLFFPEGTSSDGLQVSPFKSTLFAAFFADEMYDLCFIQPASLTYVAPDGALKRFYGWWGNMEFGPHFLQVLAASRQGRIEVKFHPPVKVSDFANRKTLAQHAENATRNGLNLVERSDP